MVARMLRPAGSKTSLGVRIEVAAGGGGDLAQQRFVVAVLEHLVFLAEKPDLGEGPRFGQRPHAEQSLVLPDRQLRAIVARSHLAHLQGRLKAVRAEGVDVGNRGRLLHVARQAVVHHQLVGGAVEIGAGLAVRRVRQQVAENVGPEPVEPGQVTQFTAQRFLASEVKTAARPRPYCQRTSSGSVRSTSRIVSEVGRAWKRT